MYSTREAAALYRVHPVTLMRYTKLPENPLKGVKKNLRGDMEFREDELIEFAQRHQIDLQPQQQ